MFQRIADRFGISVNVVYITVALAATLVAYILWRNRGANAAALSGSSTSSTTSGGSILGGLLNGPWSSGAPGTTANPLPTAPDGGADTGTTPAPPISSGTPILAPGPGGVNPPPSATTNPPVTSTTVTYVHPQRGQGLSQIASQHGTTLAKLESFPENQYIRQRGSWNLIYTTDRIRIA